MFMNGASKERILAFPILRPGNQCASGVMLLRATVIATGRHSGHRLDELRKGRLRTENINERRKNMRI